MARDTRLEAKLAAAIGVGANPEAMEVVKRSDFNSDGEYIQALVDWDLAHNDPKRAELTRKYARILNEQREQEARAAKEARHKEIRDSMQLTPDEANEVELAATQATMNAVRDGKVDPRDFNRARGAAVERLEKQTLDRKAGNAIFNEEIRRMYQEQKDFTPEQEKRMSRETLTDLTGGNTGNNAY